MFTSTKLNHEKHKFLFIFIIIYIKYFYVYYYNRLQMFKKLNIDYYKNY